MKRVTWYKLVYLSIYVFVNVVSGIFSYFNNDTVILIALIIFINCFFPSVYRIFLNSYFKKIEKKEEEAKILEISINGNTLKKGYEGFFISMKATNKSSRSITIESYMIYVVIVEKKITLNSLDPNSIELCDKLPCKIKKDQSCSAYLSKEILLKKYDWSYPLKVKALFSTNKGDFYSDLLVLKRLFN